MDNLKKLINELLDQNLLIKAVLSSPKHKDSNCQKAIIRPVTIKETLKYQLTRFEGPQTKDFNATVVEIKELLVKLLSEDFKQALFNIPGTDYHILVSKKGKVTIMEKKGTQAMPLLNHNRQKEYHLKEGIPVAFLAELGIMNSDGKVVAKKYDKFRQINRFLEMIDDLLPTFEKEKTLNIVDFGCGKSYLTFALYHFLKEKGFTLQITGLDLKKEVIENCNALAKKLNFTELSFLVGDIEHYDISQKIDMVVVLHACDTATDAAIGQAIKWDAQVILAVPCCQHELYSQVQNEQLAPLLKHGILRERFAALATDALRAQVLEIKGYKTQIMEFIDLEHTPKNLLIRAIKQPGKRDEARLLKEYHEIKQTLNINPSIHKQL